MAEMNGFDPVLTGVLILIGIALITDLMFRRIPNALTLGALPVVLLFRLWMTGPAGLIAGLEGMGVALLIFLPFHVCRGMGAGDVKLMAALGALFGPLQALLVAGLTLIAGGLIGVGILVVRGGVRAFLVRWWGNLVTLVIARDLSGWVRPAAGEVSMQRFPYSVAIAAGALLAVCFPHGLF